MIVVEAANSQIAESMAFKEGILISKIEQCSKEKSRRFLLWAIIIGIIVCLALVANVIALISTKLNSAVSAQKNQQIISEFEEQAELQRKQLEDANNQIALLKGTASLDKTAVPKVRSNKIPASNTVKPEKQLTPEKVLAAYLEAPTWQDRLPFVLDPDEASKIMAQMYGVMFSLPPRYYFIHPCKVEKRTIGQKICVEVDFNGEPFVPYDLIYTNDGWRIDWVASLPKWSQTLEQRIKRKYGNTFDFEVKILKKYQSLDIAIFDLEITNKSNVNISYWTMDCIAYNKNGKYLAKQMENGANFMPNATKISKVFFYSVQVDDVNNIKFALGKAEGVSEQGYDIPMIEKLFVLRQEQQKRSEESRINCFQIFTAFKTQLQIGVGYTDVLVGSILLKSTDKIGESHSNPAVSDVFDQGDHNKIEIVSQTLNDIDKNLKAIETVQNEVQDLRQSMLDCNKRLKEYYQYCSKPTGYLNVYYKEASRLRKNLIDQIKLFDDALMRKDLVGRVETSQGKSGEKVEDTVNDYHMSAISASKTRLLLQIRVSSEIAKLDGNTKKVSFLHEIETAAFLSK